MSECDVVHVLNPSKGLIDDRAAVKELFRPFGSIFKIYADIKDYATIKVYYDDPESAANAVVQLANKPPYYLKLTVKTERVRRRFDNQSLSSTIDEGSSTHSNMGDEDLEVVSGGRLYDIFGKEISIFLSDNGQAFVSVEELKQHNFPCFYEEHVPQRITKQDFLHQLRVYISVKVRKFLLLHQQYTLHPNELDTMITEVIGEYTSGKPLSTVAKIADGSRKFFDKVPNYLNHVEGGNNSLRRSDTNVKSLNNNGQPSGVNHTRKQQMNGSMVECKKENTSPNTTNLSRRSLPANVGALTNFKPARSPEINIVSIPLNTPLEVMVTHAINERKCYVSIRARKQHLMSLLCKVQIEAKKSSAVVPEVGNIYAAQYEGDWYRACVLSTKPLKVRYIDYGNENEEPLTEVRPLSKELCNEPAEAICVSFGTNPINIPLDYGTVLNITALKQNIDKTYQVRKTSEKTEEPLRRPGVTEAKQTKPKEIPKSEPVDNKCNSENLNTNSSPSISKVSVGKKKSEENVTPNKNVHSSSPVVTPTTNSGESSVKDGKKSGNSPRKTIMDVYTTGPGIVEYLGTMQEKDICFVLPANSINTELNHIDGITNETSSDKSYKATTGDCVAVFKKDDDKWVRATVIDQQKNNSYTVALIDYGIIETTDTIRKLPKDIADVPEFCCVCTGSAKFAEEIKKDALNFEIVDKNKFNVTYPDDTTESIVCTRWDPIVINNFETKPEEKEQPEPVFTVRPKSKSLLSDDVVIISNFNDGKLLVRTQECHRFYNSVKDGISKYTATPLKQPPQVNQIVLCPYENSKELHRAIISNINKDVSEVDYIDLGIINEISVGKLSSISEALATTDFTLIAITLNGFEDGVYNEKALTEIEKHCQEKTRFIAKFISNDIFDLLTNDKKSLSTTLKEANRFLYTDLPKQDAKSGQLDVLCINNEQIDDGFAFFMCRDPVATRNLELITEVCAKAASGDPYVPIVDEICFASYDDDEWYRARVLVADPDANQFKVVYIDYGNEGVVSSDKIRLLHDDLKTIPPNPMNFKINDFNGLVISAGNAYLVQILNKNDDFYLVDLTASIQQ